MSNKKDTNSGRSTTPRLPSGRARGSGNIQPQKNSTNPGYSGKPAVSTGAAAQTKPRTESARKPKNTTPAPFGRGQAAELSSAQSARKPTNMIPPESPFGRGHGTGGSSAEQEPGKAGRVANEPLLRKLPVSKEKTSVGAAVQLKGRIESPKNPPGRPVSFKEDIPSMKNVEEPGWVCLKCTFKNNPTRPGCEQCSTSKPSGDAQMMVLTKCSNFGQENSPEATKCPKYQTPKPMLSDDLEEHPDVSADSQGGWACPQCSFKNRPRRPGCEMCGGEPPADYDLSQAPRDPEEEARLQTQRENERKFLEAMEKKNQEELEELCQKDSQVLVQPDRSFECLVCMTVIEVADGVRLRGCLHDMCKQCIVDSVVNEETGIVRCAMCGIEVEDRDIRNVVDPDLWERRLKMLLKTGEAKVKNTFHCLTVDCEGWVEVVDAYNWFQCQVCREINCLICRAQHRGTCRQHQDELRRKCTSEEDAKATEQYIEDMIKSGNMMRCPGCKLVLLKKVGCDWMQCPQCEMEICWATRGPRWGPKGKGDISGGCRCGINGRCHPSCGFCH